MRESAPVVTIRKGKTNTKRLAEGFKIPSKSLGQTKQV